MNLEFLSWGLVVAGLGTFAVPAARIRPRVRFAWVIGVAVLYAVVGWIVLKLFNIEVVWPANLMQSLLIAPLTEELIFRQPLVFVRQSWLYWPLGVLSGGLFIWLHQRSSLPDLLLLGLGTGLLLWTFRRYGLVGSFALHVLLNLTDLLYASVT